MSSFTTKPKKLTREDLEPPKIPLLTLESLKAMCNFYDEENPTTYEIFLRYRPDLGEEEVAHYREIIDTLKENEALKREVIADKGLRYFSDMEESSCEVFIEPVGKCFRITPAEITLDMMNM